MNVQRNGGFWVFQRVFSKGPVFQTAPLKRFFLGFTSNVQKQKPAFLVTLRSLSCGPKAEGGYVCFACEFAV